VQSARATREQKGTERGGRQEQRVCALPDENRAERDKRTAIDSDS